MHRDWNYYPDTLEPHGQICQISETMEQSPSIAMDLNGLSILNPNPKRLSGPSLLHDLVCATSASGHPAIASLSEDGSQHAMCYEELHQAADNLVSRISETLGQTIGTSQAVIPLLIPQGPDLYISLLAILKAGGAFCPLNLDAPEERVRFILEDVSAKIVLTTSEFASKIPTEDGRTVLLVDGLEQVRGRNTCSDTSAPAQDSSLAYIMYTSGSTGTPKGVGVSHSAATQSLLSHNRHIPDFDRFLQFAAPTFDVSVFEIFFPLSRGRTVVTCSRRKLLNDLPGVIRTLNVDACELTPTVAGSLLRSRASVPSLKLLLTIGEMLSKPVIEEFGGTPEHPSILWAMYGPTEAAIHWYDVLLELPLV